MSKPAKGDSYFNLKGKKAERVVHELAAKTFLSDWCYENPRLPDGKELCDLLVVFDDIAIIWQIKDLKLSEDGKYKRKEVEKNLRQLAGARRQLFQLKRSIALENPRRGREMFDARAIKHVHLVSALLGEGEEFFSAAEEIENSPIHVFDRDFTNSALSELDTISDFVEYLSAKESLLAQNKALVMVGGEQQLLAFYLLNGRNFERLERADHIFIEDGSWQHFQSKPEYQGKRKADEVSYLWDSIIDRAHEARKYEIVARALARPNRFVRRQLSGVFLDARVRAHEATRHDLYRRALTAEGVTYCFLFADDPEPRERRRAMLHAFCFVARGRFRENRRVLGIATEMKIRPECSYDFCLLEIPNWTEEQQREMDRLQRETGILVNPTVQRVTGDEYPRSSKGQ